MRPTAQELIDMLHMEIRQETAGGSRFFSVKCPFCKRYYGRYTALEQAVGNEECPRCLRKDVERGKKWFETGDDKYLRRDKKDLKHDDLPAGGR